VTFKLLSVPKYAILSSFSKEEYKAIRKDIITNILATDIQEHFRLLKEFEGEFAPQNPRLG